MPVTKARRGDAENAEHDHGAVEPRAALEARRAAPSGMPKTSTRTVLKQAEKHGHAEALARWRP